MLKIASKSYKSDEASVIDDFIGRNRGRKVVVIQGLGFVGSAMLTAVASAKAKNGVPMYAVIGVDLPSPSSYWKIAEINNGKLPIKSLDRQLSKTFSECFKFGNIIATASEHAYEVANFVLVNINLDAEKGGIGKVKQAKICIDNFVSSVRGIARKIKPSSLVIIETTVPPGTCEKILVPLFKSEFKRRGYGDSEINLVYSYERVMPGKNYLKSIISYYRVFSGINTNCKRKTRNFFKSIIDTDSYPLTELESLTAAEIGKVLENSYRAANIAFIEEWTELAETAGVNLYEIIAGIRMRETHKNIMSPGFGVGGYCLPKDPILADWSNIKLFGREKHLHISLKSIDINDKMPLHSFGLLKRYLNRLGGKEILLMGVSYTKDVADTRSSPSRLFYKRCIKNHVTVLLHDPLVTYWPELNLNIMNDLDVMRNKKVDAIVFAVNHDIYMQMTPKEIARLLKQHGLILDCNNIIDDQKAFVLRKMGFKIAGVGKGHWNKILER
jgi:UDP-N-acetyl-D-glucosamine dehydrogenase